MFLRLERTVANPLNKRRLPTQLSVTREGFDFHPIVQDDQRLLFRLAGKHRIQKLLALILIREEIVGRLDQQARGVFGWFCHELDAEHELGDLNGVKRGALE